MKGTDSPSLQRQDHPLQIVVRVDVLCGVLLGVDGVVLVSSSYTVLIRCRSFSRGSTSDTRWSSVFIYGGNGAGVCHRLHILFMQTACSLSDICSKASCKSPRSEGTPLRLDRGVSSPLLSPLSSPSPSPPSGDGGGGLRRGCFPPCVDLA